ncbi:hypothetical protein M9H77_26687 [Catharanthus roseus]|uniref:Uncharacterized protein n=1 Tax=Catharanthus roseus TaxID=4058 RepID=A0ACC0AAQ1_CATRO|nr:hypothetical protein M9H77_26687 [Catharanthus roseus]
MPYSDAVNVVAGLGVSHHSCVRTLNVSPYRGVIIEGRQISNVRMGCRVGVVMASRPPQYGNPKRIVVKLGHAFALCDQEGPRFGWFIELLKIYADLPSPIGAEDQRHWQDRDLPWTVGLILSFAVDYSQGCLELKKEEQSRATSWGLIGPID